MGKRSGRPVRATYVVDGSQVSSLADFWRLLSEAVNGPGGYFAGNFDALRDSLRGGMGQADQHCTFVLEHSEHVRQALSGGRQERQVRSAIAPLEVNPRAPAPPSRMRSSYGSSDFETLVAIFSQSPATLEFR